MGLSHSSPAPVRKRPLGLHLSNRFKAEALLVLITMIWGSTFIIVKSALDSVGPFVFIATRFWIAGLGLLAIGLARRRKLPISWALVREGGLTGIFLTLAFVTQTIGLQTTEAGKAAFITGLSVVLVPFFAALFLHRPPARATLAGALLATVGLGLMTLTHTLTLATGDMWVLACALGFALHIFSTGLFSPRHATLPFALAQLFTVAVLNTAAALVLESHALLLPLPLLPITLYMGIIATGAIYFTQSWAQQHTTSSRTALIFVLEPVFAALFAVIVAQERLAARQWFGALLILIGMLTAEIGKKDEA